MHDNLEMIRQQGADIVIGTIGRTYQFFHGNDAHDFKVNCGVEPLSL